MPATQRAIPGGLLTYRTKLLAPLHWAATQTWLSDKQTDINELKNVASDNVEQLKRMQQALREKLIECDAPSEQLERLGLN